MEELMSLLARCAGPDTYQIVLSDPRDAEQEEKRVTLTKRGLAWQIERFRNDQAFHENVEQEELLPMLAQLMEHFKQLNAWDPEHQYSLKLTKKGGTDLELNTDYTVTAGTSGMGSITLTDTFRASLADYVEIVISYQGKLNANTNTLQAYTNTAKLDFGPAANRDSRSDSAHVYSGHISFYKKDNSGNDLAGAKFVVKNKDGKYAKLNGSGLSYSFVEWVDDEATATVITTTGAATEIIVRGLAAGTYTLVETEAPSSYIKGADTDVRINKTVDETTMSVTALSTNAVTVINTKGTELPGTGGIGTTIFYTAGGLLVLGAVVLFIVKRRKTA